MAELALQHPKNAEQMWTGAQNLEAIAVAPNLVKNCQVSVFTHVILTRRPWEGLGIYALTNEVTLKSDFNAMCLN
jgi:hypothetical protein